MKFALGMPALILYPPIASPWERDASGADVVRIAQKADRSGWDWLTVSEHVVMPLEMADVMGRRFPEALSAAAVLAGATQRVKVLTYVLVLGYRHPLLLAKQISTLDFLSGGRIVLGAGIGHLQREFALLGASFEERGAIADEGIRLMKELWTNPNASFHGKYFQVKDVAFEPMPVQKPHPPILVGGNSKPAMRRAARHGDGWLPWLVTREQLPGCLDYVRQQPGYREPFEVVMPLTELKVEDYSHREVGRTRIPGADRAQLVDAVGRLRDAGATVTQLVAPRTESVEELLDWVEWFAENVIPVFRR